MNQPGRPGPVNAFPARAVPAIPQPARPGRPVPGAPAQRFPQAQPRAPRPPAQQRPQVAPPLRPLPPRAPHNPPTPPRPYAPAAPQPAPEQPGPPPRPRKRKIGGWIAVLVILSGLGGAGWYATHTAPASAAVGDCLAQTGGNELTKVGCGDPSARFEVLAKLENKTMVDASINACADVPKATSSYWEGKSGEVGLVLCLAPVEPVAAPKK